MDRPTAAKCRFPYQHKTVRGVSEARVQAYILFMERILGPMDITSVRP